jgi:rod shape-determining protein MreD
MIRRYLVLPPLALGLVILQTSIVEVFTAERISLELTTAAVIYAGLFMETGRGAVLTFLMGYFMDVLITPFPGLYILTYGIIFFGLSSVSTRVYSTNTFFLISVTFLSVLAEGIILVSLYYIIYDMNVLVTGLKIYLPQACILSGLSPTIFNFCRRLELKGYGNGKSAQQAQWP